MVRCLGRWAPPLALGAALGCSAGATQYVSEEDEPGPALSEFGAGAPPGVGLAPGAAAADPAAATSPAAPAVDEPPARPAASGEGPLTPLPLPPAPAAGGSEAPATSGAEAPASEAPAAGGAEAPAAGAPTDEVASPSGCTLAVSVTTVSPGGRYAPRNVGAIWVTDAEDRFIRSLNVWGDRRLRHVEAWNAATEAAGVAGNVVDAVTGATAPSHAARVGTWDCLDLQGQPVPDGPYRVHFEVTESNGAGPTTFANFTKGPIAERVETGAPSFEAITLDFTP